MNTSPEMTEQIRLIIEAAGYVFRGIQLALDKRFPEVVFDGIMTPTRHVLPFNPDKFDAEKFATMVRNELDEQQEKKMTLREKLYEVYKTINFVDKGGHNKAQNYKYVMAADVTHAVRRQLIAQRVYAEINYDFVGLPYTIARAKEKDAPFTAVNVKCSIVFHDLDTGEKLTASGLGTGADTGDKAGYKAMTGGLKYALKNAFLIPDEADPEADESVDEGYSGSQRLPEPDDEMPDFQMARHAAPQPRQPVKPEAVPLPPQEPEKVAPAAPRAPKPSAIEGSVPSSIENPMGYPAPVNPPQQGDAYEGPDEDTTMPTEVEMVDYRNRFSELGDVLSTDGKLTASKGLKLNRKLLVFLLKTTGRAEAAQITKAQWENFFGRVQVGKDNPAVGLVGITKLVNKANGLEEKK